MGGRKSGRALVRLVGALGCPSVKMSLKMRCHCMAAHDDACIPTCFGPAAPHTHHFQAGVFHALVALGEDVCGHPMTVHGGFTSAVIDETTGVHAQSAAMAFSGSAVNWHAPGYAAVMPTVVLCSTPAGGLVFSMKRNGLLGGGPAFTVSASGRLALGQRSDPLVCSVR